MPCQNTCCNRPCQTIQWQRIPTHPSKDTMMDIDAVVYNICFAIYTLTVILGVTGNSLVIWVASFKLKPTVNNVWLVNLAVADLIFCVTRALSLTEGHSLLSCKFNGFFKYANMFCSVFLLAVISVDRMLCVWCPVFTRNRRTLHVARAIGAGVWLLSSALSAPYFHYREVYLGSKNVTKCRAVAKDSNNTNEDVILVLNAVRFSCGFLLPFVVILLCYILTGIGIRRTGLAKRSRPLRILASLVVAFFLCWAPYHCLQLLSLRHNKSLVVKIGLQVAKALAYFNSCVNPLLYFAMGVDLKAKFRQSLAGVFRTALAEDEEIGTSGVDGGSYTQSHALSAEGQP